jgi:hypothetical protein
VAIYRSLDHVARMCAGEGHEIRDGCVPVHCARVGTENVLTSPFRVRPLPKVLPRHDGTQRIKCLRWQDPKVRARVALHRILEYVSAEPMFDWPLCFWHQARSTQQLGQKRVPGARAQHGSVDGVRIPTRGLSEQPLATGQPRAQLAQNIEQRTLDQALHAPPFTCPLRPHDPLTAQKCLMNTVRF